MKEKLEHILSNAMSQIEQSGELDKLNEIRVAFLGKKGYLEADFDKEKEIAEFFEIDLGQAEKERIELVRSFSSSVPIDIFAIQGEIEGMPELNVNGVNKKIKAHIFSDEKMRMMGFSDHCKDRWYF